MWICKYCETENENDCREECKACGKLRQSSNSVQNISPPPPRKKWWLVVTATLFTIVILLLVMYSVHKQQDRMKTLFQVENPVIQVYAGDYYSLAVHDDGTVLFAGDIDRWRNAVSEWENVESVDGCFARLKDGTYTSFFGATNLPVYEQKISISMGSAGNWVALLPDGMLLFTPDPESVDKFDTIDVVGYGITDYRYKEFVFGADSYFGLLESGRVVPYSFSFDINEEIAAWTDVKNLCFCDGYVPLALTNSGKVLSTSSLENVDTSNWKNIVKLTENYSLTVGLCADGTVLATGGEYGIVDYLDQFTKWKNVEDVAVSRSNWDTSQADCFAVGLKKDGTVLFAGDLSDPNCAEIQRKTASWTSIIQISTGTHHVVGLKADGTVVSAGDNSFGQCDIYNGGAAAVTTDKDDLSSLILPQKEIWLCNGEKYTKLNGSIGGHVDYTYEYNNSVIVKETVGDPGGSYLYQILDYDTTGVVTSVTTYERNTIVTEQKNNTYGEPIEISFYGCENSGEFFYFGSGEIIIETLRVSDNTSCEIDFITKGVTIKLEPSQKAIISYDDAGKIERIICYDLSGQKLLSNYIIHDSLGNAYQIEYEAGLVISWDDNNLVQTVVYRYMDKEYIRQIKYDDFGRFDCVDHILEGQYSPVIRYDYSINNGYIIEQYMTDINGNSSLFATDTFAFDNNGQLVSRIIKYFLDDGGALEYKKKMNYDENGNMICYIENLGGISEEHRFVYFSYA